MPILKPYTKRRSTTSSISPYFTVNDLKSIYRYPEPDMTRHPVVGVISFGGGLYGVPPQSTPYVIPPSSDATDLQQYWTYLGIPVDQMPTVIVYPVDSVNDLTDSGSIVENTADVSIVGACCPNPNLTIVLFLFPNSYSFTEVLPIVINGITVNQIKYVPTILSISWGAPETEYLVQGVDVTGELTNVYTILQKATAAGLNVCVAAGDNGSTDGTSGLSVDFPASCPFVTALGGTSLVCPNKIYDSHTIETVWNNGIYQGMFNATGGGTSAYYKKPNYQSSLPGTYRKVPDIALNSDPNTGYTLIINGQFEYGVGGTSMAAPMFAGYLASLQSLPFVNNTLYSISAFHDITQGTNDTSSKYVATKGYDCCSGLGSIDGTRLKTALSKPILVSTILFNKTSITLNLFSTKTVQLTVQLKPSTASNKKLRWVSNNPSIGTVTSTGLVSAKKKGIFTVGAFSTDGSNVYALVRITVKSSWVIQFK